MLSERHMELLTAYVDGELTPAQGKAALHLVESSLEARAVLRELQEAAQHIRELPRRTLGNEFADQVLQTISRRALRPNSERADAVCNRRGSARRRPTWIYAAAACLILAVGLGVYLATRPQRVQDPLLAELKKLPDPTKNQPRSFPVPEAAPPLRLTFADLTQKEQQAALAERLAKETAVRLDIAVRDQADAVRQLVDVLQAQGIKALIDPRVQASLKGSNKSNIDYSVYTEGVSANELAGILRQLAEAPKQSPKALGPQARATQSPPRAIFKSLVVRPLSMDDRENIASRLGVDASKLAPRPPTGPDNKGFSEGLQANATRRDGRYALIWASDAGELPSAAIKTFLAGQREQRPAGIQVLLIIRQA